MNKFYDYTRVLYRQISQIPFVVSERSKESKKGRRLDNKGEISCRVEQEHRERLGPTSVHKLLSRPERSHSSLAV